MGSTDAGTLLERGRLLGGRYRAETLLGQGGMGEVWRCLDVEHDRHVAVKVVKQEHTRTPWRARLFHSEVLAMAKLAHPSIIPIYDFADEPEIGSFFVMEYRPGRPLAHLMADPPPWPALAQLFDDILDALAYAHAKGVLHMDMKPDNVLVSFGPDGRLHPTLLDFGIARVHRPGHGVEEWRHTETTILGTVDYMAPEQASGELGRFGRWTDLYSVGTILYELVAGHVPFDRGNPVMRLAMRIVKPARALVARPRYEIPSVLPAVVAELLQTEPWERPRFAADARDMLRGVLEDAPRLQESWSGAVFADAPERSTEDATAPLRLRRSNVPTAAAPLWPQESDELLQDRNETLDAISVWSEDPEPPTAGAYGLYGLRDLPVLGRTAEREIVWNEARAAFADGMPRAVFLEGDAGVGKSRLARDLIERGEELGLLDGIQTWWSAAGQADEGVRGLLENALSSRDADRIKIIEHIDFWLKGLPGEHELFERDLRLFLRPPDDATFDDKLPYRVTLELLERACVKRPVLLWLDDLQWGGEEAMELLRRLLRHPPPLPVCVVATVRCSEGVPPGYDELVQAERCRVLRLEQLDRPATVSFLRGLLDVSDELVEVLADRAEGNPLFAAQLLHQLVEADAFERVAGRYRLSGNFDLDAIPADIGALWEHRVNGALPDPALRRALLPLVVVRARLSAALQRALQDAVGLDRSWDGDLFEEALRRAHAAGLLEVQEGALRLIHGLLRDHLLRQIPDADRPALHALSAAALRPLAYDGEDCQMERADHLRLAGENEACVSSARAALAHSRVRGETEQIRARAERMLAWLDDGAVAVETPGPARACALIELARLDHMQGDLDAADAKLAEALPIGSIKERRNAQLRQAMVLRKRGDYDGALALYDKTLASAETQGDASSAAEALFGKAESLRRIGRAEEAVPLYMAALAKCGLAENERLASWVSRSLGILLLDRGESEAARERFEQAREVMARIGDANGELMVESALGGWHDRQDNYPPAVAHNERVLAIAQRLELAYFEAFAHVNLAIVHAKRGNTSALRRHLHEAGDTPGGLRSADVRTGHAYLLTELAALERDHEEAILRLSAATKLQAETGFVDTELALSLERCIEAVTASSPLRERLASESARLRGLIGHAD